MLKELKALEKAAAKGKNELKTRIIETRIVVFRNEPCTEHVYAISRHHDG